MQHALVTTTFATVAEANTMVRSVLEARLAACVQQWPVQSDYLWQGAIEQAQEIFVQFKTRGELVEALQQHILARHSYQTPQVLVYAIASGHAPYLAWVYAETAQKA